MWRVANSPRITVADFFAAGRAPLQLVWEANPEAAVGRIITEVALNRPGLALAGFRRYFANRRLQVFGLAEMAYLGSLPPEERSQRLRALGRVPALVMSRGRRLPAYAREVVEHLKIPVMRTQLVTGHFMNNATVLLQNMTSPRIRVAGTMVEINGVGVLLEGEPGIGKSEIALALIERGHSLVSDDTTVLMRDSTGTIQGSAVEITRHHMEIRGLGIIHVPSLFGIASMRNERRLDLIICMRKAENVGGDIDRTGLETASRNVLGVEIPLITVPVAPGRDLTNVVEVAALNQRMKQMGRDAARELDEKLKVALARKD
ncbi:MAG TPA: HPr(Ser) kinase/phosphatase [Kiritimatiellia bacterium]|jgi:HPr kinase/phosphorylase|nr:HPr(Ser) kinase/phosphatase [Kiritimatiellia bacterium]OQC56235.1 MAG: HPr kinase/phosphorylase [Verrucomicrobia bacterium ADurb.Bin018]MBP9572757.1 HPr(Ser) kinase/phosphatase [Kiritimatiellia bacterium]HOE00836.1 HPr(Ser) kinase/phosphatase [Kiritimatiellia bacterium]HOR75033.1 HPr(Ser) kinase/phosphatase [Kiritimatiellia bacterium]